MSQTLHALAEFTAARLIGDGNIEIEKVASLAHAQTGDLVFVESDRHLEDALNSKASAVIAGEFAAGSDGRKPLSISPRPRFAFATAAKLLYPRAIHSSGIHPSAVVDPSAKLAPGANVGALAVVEANAVIGERTFIASGCHIGEGVVIGDDCEIYP